MPFRGLFQFRTSASQTTFSPLSLSLSLFSPPLLIRASAPSSLPFTYFSQSSILFFLLFPLPLVHSLFDHPSLLRPSHAQLSPTNALRPAIRPFETRANLTRRLPHHTHHTHTYIHTPTTTTTTYIYLLNMPAFELRSGGDVKNKKQSVADLKYRRLTELNARLKEDLDRPRVKVSEAALS